MHYILNQQEDSLLLRFFQAQLDIPIKGDWVSEAKTWIKDYEIENSFQEVKNNRKGIYEHIISEKVQEEAFQYLKNKIKSKGSKIEYGARFNMQDYLKPNSILTFKDKSKYFHTDLK